MPRDLEEAASLYEQGLQYLSLDSFERLIYQNHLSDVLMMKWQSTHLDSDLENVITSLRVSAYAPESDNLDFSRPRYEAASKLAHLLHTEAKGNSHERLLSALEVYALVIPMIGKLVSAGSSVASRLNDLPAATHLACDAAACTFQLAETDPDSAISQMYLRQAVELLEQGRGITWMHLTQFQVDLASLEEIHPRVAHRLSELSQILRGASHRDSASAQWEGEGAIPIRRLGAGWEDLLQRTRRLPGFEDFLAPIPLHKLRDSLGEIPAIVVNVSDYRCDALVIPRSGDITFVPLPLLTITKIITWRRILDFNVPSSRHFDHNDENARASRRMRDPERDGITNLLNQVWISIADPILPYLKELGLFQGTLRRVYWSLTGALAFIPVHAACPRVSTELDLMQHVVSSYIPTLTTLHLALAKTKRDHFRFLAVSQYWTPGTFNPLRGVKGEMEMIRGLPMSPEAVTYLEDHDATISSLRDALIEHSFTHFACHAQQNVKQALESSFLLHDGQLSLAILSQTALPHADFAMLLACESARGAVNVSNEFIHLAAGLLVVGFRSVIGTMWSILDSDGPDVARVVYEHLFRSGVGAKPDSSEAALALHRAVLYLRDKKKAPPSRWLPFVHFGV